MKISSELSEICGIHAGDGHLRKDFRELEISGSFEEKGYYDNWVIPLFSQYCDLQLTGQYFLTKKTYGLRIYNKRIKETLLDLGFPAGKKSVTVKIPSPILHSQKSAVRLAFLRGIFDTDGCLTFDRKTSNDNVFQKARHYYPRIVFSSVSKNLIEGVNYLAKEEGFRCKIHTYTPLKITENKKYVLQTVGKESLFNWIAKVSPKNFVKLSRFYVWQRFGFCPANTTLQERVKILKGELNPHCYYGPVA